MVVASWLDELEVKRRCRHWGCGRVLGLDVELVTCRGDISTNEDPIKSKYILIDITRLKDLEFK